MLRALNRTFETLVSILEQLHERAEHDPIQNQQRQQQKYEDEDVRDIQVQAQTG
jgi:hypothetical protein